MFPITVTLHDAAQLTAVMQALSHMTGTPTTEKAAPKSEAPKSSKAAATPAAGTLAPAKSEPAAAAPTDPKPETSTGSSAKPSASVDYPTLQKAVYQLAGKSREAATELCATFGVKTFKELPDTKWGEALAAVTAKISELEAA